MTGIGTADNCFIRRIRIHLLMVLLCCLYIPASSQDTLPSTINPQPENIETPSNRIKWVAGLNAAGIGGSLILLNEAWYKNQARSKFHFFNDSREWLQVDKTGHAWSAYTGARSLTELWQWAGIPHRKAAWIGSITSFGYLTGIELLDGFASKWGWSWSDMIANTAGTGMFLAQELGWQEQRIQFKFSFHGNSYNHPQLADRADNLFGASKAERMLKDYNAQTYWLSANIRSFFPESNWPAWLNIAAGYGAGGMYGGFENKWDTDMGIVDRTDISRLRQFYIAPDIDFTKIKTRSKFLKTTFSILNSFKFPAPALQLDSKGKLRAYAIYF